MTRQFNADLSGVIFNSNGSQLIGGFYKTGGDTPGPTAILLHGLPGIEKHLDIAYRLRDAGWNCLYFHFRGCWGSQGNYSLNGLTEDTRAAVNWVLTQPCVDDSKIVLIAGSTGSYPALMLGATDERIKAVVGVSPVITPKKFLFPKEMADNFAKMLTGITGEQMIHQWEALESLQNPIRDFSPRPLLLIAAGNDEIFPVKDYENEFRDLPNVEIIEKKETDHGFSTCRSWLVETVADWLNTKMLQANKKKNDV